MTDLSSAVMTEHHHLSTLEQLAAWCAWALAGALFLTVGWMAVEPDDPLGAVSILARQGAWTMLVQAMGLAAVTAGFATVLVGRRISDAGTFAAALGLAVVSLRGATTESLLLHTSDALPETSRGLAAEMALESVGWFVVVLAALAVSAVVMRWCFGGHDAAAAESAHAAFDARYSTTGFDVPIVGRVFFGAPVEYWTPPADGLKFTGITAVVSLLAFSILSTGMSNRAIQHGQACFVVAASVGCGVYFAHRVIPVRSALWSILAVGIIAVVAYLWASMRSAPEDAPPGVPPSNFLRVLPIQFIAVGTAAAISTFWSMLRHWEQVPQSAQRPAPTPST